MQDEVEEVDRDLVVVVAADVDVTRDENAKAKLGNDE
jgi:hypothetical protein